MAKRRSGGSDAPKSDVYVGLLALALLAQIVASVFLFLDYNTIQGVQLPKLQKFTWSGDAPGGAAPAGAAGGGAPVPGGGN